MTIAKASTEEQEEVFRFVQALEDEIKYRGMSDERLAAFVRKAPCMFRVAFGYQVLVDNVCDPASDCLAFRSDIATAIVRNNAWEALHMANPPQLPLL